MIRHPSVPPQTEVPAPIPTGLSPRGHALFPVRCVLFDIYGTLFISASGDIGAAEMTPDTRRALAGLMQTYGLTNTPDALVDTLHATIRREHRQRRQTGSDHPEIEIDRIWSELIGDRSIDTIRDFASKFESIVNPVYPMPHAAETLSVLKRYHVRMGIISNAQFFTPRLFDAFFGSSTDLLGFDADLIRYSYRVGHAKPSPVLFESVLERLERDAIRPSQVLYVGNDMRNDIYPAHRTGMQTALFAGDRRSLRLRKNDPCCKNLMADIVITDLIQLLQRVRFEPASHSSGERHED